MSTGLSSDQIVKLEIKKNVKNYRGNHVKLRIFTDSSNFDQKPVKDGGLTFSYNGIDYGSCDAGWFQDVYNDGTEVVPLIALEGTDALNRGSSGDAQYQRFHHAIGAVLSGYIGIYYLRKGPKKVRLDLYEMAYQVSKNNTNGGVYLIIQDLKIIDELLELIIRFGRKSKNVRDYLNNYIEWMHKFWYINEFKKKYKGEWDVFGEKRSTPIITDNYVIKYGGRKVSDFTNSSQRAGHIALGEMYITKYLFYGKKIYYLFPRFERKDIDFLDIHKKDDKEWNILRNEDNVELITIDDLVGVSESNLKNLEKIKNSYINTNPGKKIYKDCIEEIVKGLKNGTIYLKLK